MKPPHPCQPGRLAPAARGPLEIDRSPWLSLTMEGLGMGIPRALELGPLASADEHKQNLGWEISRDSFATSATAFQH